MADWKVSEYWDGEGDYMTGRCPRCESADIEWDHEESYYNADCHIIPGQCKVCGLTFREFSLAEIYDEGGIDYDARLVVRDYDIDEDEDDADSE